MAHRRDSAAKPAQEAVAGGNATALRAGGAPSSLLDITIALPTGPDGRRPEPVIRPALAVLYRVAVGPAADRYVRRFLAFERAGGGRARWHWPALLAPAVWAFYRRLWGFGIVFALLPLVGGLAFLDIGPQIDHSRIAWLGCALVMIWLLPGIIPALFADALLYRRVRGEVAIAERTSASSKNAVERLSQRPATSASSAVLFGGGAVVLALTLLLPGLHAGYVDLGVRAKVSESLAAVRGLQREIEETWASSRLVPRQTANASVRTQVGGRLIEDLNVSPASGRVRVAWGEAVPQLAGKAVLLAPAVDPRERVQWLCVPVDIPARFLPRACRA